MKTLRNHWLKIVFCSIFLTEHVQQHRLSTNGQNQQIEEGMSWSCIGREAGRTQTSSFTGIVNS